MEGSGVVDLYGLFTGNRPYLNKRSAGYDGMVQSEKIGGGQRVLLGASFFPWVRAAKIVRAADRIADGARIAAIRAGSLALPFRPKLILTKVMTYNRKSGGNMTALEHIMMSHAHRGSTFGAAAGRFAKGTNAEDVRSLIDEASISGKFTFRPGNGVSIVHDMNRVIGTDRLGNPATKLQVFFDEIGNVTTAYPFN